MTCPRQEELQERALSAAPLTEAELAHVSGCSFCQAAIEEAQAMAADLALPERGLAGPDFTDRVLAKLDDRPAAPRPRSFRRWAPVAGLAAAAALVIGLNAQAPGPDPAPPEATPGLRPKAGLPEAPSRWVSLEVARVVDDALVDPAGSLRARDHLAFAIVNRAGSPHRFVSVLGVDAQGRLHWFFPAADAPPDDTVAIAVSPHRQVLPYAVQRHLPAGPLEIIAVFSPGPLPPRAVEEALRAANPLGLRPGRLAPLDVPEAGQHSLLFEVNP